MIRHRGRERSAPGRAMVPPLRIVFHPEQLIPVCIAGRVHGKRDAGLSRGRVYDSREHGAAAFGQRPGIDAGDGLNGFAGKQILKAHIKGQQGLFPVAPFYAQGGNQSK